MELAKTGNDTNGTGVAAKRGVFVSNSKAKEKHSRVLFRNGYLTQGQAIQRRQNASYRANIFQLAAARRSGVEESAAKAKNGLDLTREAKRQNRCALAAE